MATLEQILTATLKRDGSTPSGETLIVHNHISQQKLFGIRKGIELYPNQDDDYDTRLKFIQSLYKSNKIDLYLDRFWDLMLCKGQMLFYLRPTGSTYKILWFDKDAFRPYYDGDGDLVEVVIIYSYRIRSEYSQHELKWLRLRINKDYIWRSQTDSKPSFEGIDSKSWIGREEQTVNTLGFIPCVVVNNYVSGPGMDGIGEFDWLKDQIESHDEMMQSQSTNLKFFGNPTLVSTRSSSELVEAGVDDASGFGRPTLSSNGGWYGSTISTRKEDPVVRRGGSGVRIKRVIGNVQPDERFGYVAPDPTSPDHARHISEVRESIHYALGGIDELGLRSGATAYEMKTIYGKVAATAAKKCLHLYDYGLCQVFELAIAAEEKLFKDTLAYALKKESDAITDEFALNLLRSGKLPKGVMGLPPGGDRQIAWRFTGPVFEDSPQDLLQKSIVVRNLQELGVQSLEGLKFLFADKTEKELLNILAGGYPFRYVQELLRSYQQMLGLLQQSLNIPGPQDPNVPLAAMLPIVPLLESTLKTLFHELNYGKQFDPADPNSDPSIQLGRGDYSIRDTTTVQSDERSGDASSSTANSSTGSLAAAGINPPPTQSQSGSGEQQSVEGGVRQARVVPEFSRPLPVPGGTVDPKPIQHQRNQELQQWSAVPGAPVDLQQYPSILQQLFPTFTGLGKRRGSGKRGKSKRTE